MGNLQVHILGPWVFKIQVTGMDEIQSVMETPRAGTTENSVGDFYI